MTKRSNKLKKSRSGHWYIPFNDRERILTALVMRMVAEPEYWSSEIIQNRVHKLVVGELVCTYMAGRVDNWNVGFLHKIWDEGDGWGERYLIRDIETGELCRWSNVMMIPVGRFLKETDLLVGNERKFYLKLLKAIKKDEYFHRFWSLEFPEPGKYQFWVRDRIADLGPNGQYPALYKIEGKWTAKMSIKSLKDYLYDSGYSTNKPDILRQDWWEERYGLKSENPRKMSEDEFAVLHRR